MDHNLACVFVGLDFEKWLNGEYPTWVMAEAVATYFADRYYKMHVEDAIAREQKRKSK